MGVRNCSRCGRIFNYVAGQLICEHCRKSQEQDFQRVKEFVKENPNKGIREVAEACEVTENQLRQWIREERLEFAKGSGVLNCDQCGAPISTGRFCEKCKANMTNSLNNAIRPQMEARKQAESAAATHRDSKMRFIKT